MKVCSKCGQQIHDDAVICIHCGCSTQDAPKKIAKSPDYNRLVEFAGDARSIFVLGIFSLALSMGIGIIFQIINLSKIKQYRNPNGNGFVFPKLNLTNQKDIDDYESAKKKFNTGRTLTLIGWCITIPLLFILFMLLMTSFQY